MDYEKDMQIEEDALDLECLEQARLMLRYCQLAARLEKEEDLAKENLNLVKAEIDKDIRTNPAKYGIDKITEGAIANAIIMDPRYKEASQHYIDARFEANAAAGAVKACEQRKSMLETLARLHGQQYFAGPAVPRDIVKEREKRMKIENEMATILNRKRTRQ
ncbi:MAG TPA: hypothetical protein PK588_10545 [Paludibacteraceae bacterium]|nr:hypothetical protein [Paludibacteraceae bacterium]